MNYYENNDNLIFNGKVLWAAIREICREAGKYRVVPLGSAHIKGIQVLHNCSLLWKTAQMETPVLKLSSKRNERLTRILIKSVIRIFWRYLTIKNFTCFLNSGPGYGMEENYKICWEAPLAICLWTEEGPVMGMAVEFWNDTLCIRQLQGVGGAKIPEELRMWPLLFTQACIQFAKRAGFKRVRLYRAHTSEFYRRPVIEGVPPDQVEERKRNIRQGMRRRYDGTARKAKLVMKKNWSEWTNPKF